MLDRLACVLTVSLGLTIGCLGLDSFDDGDVPDNPIPVDEIDVVDRPPAKGVCSTWARGVPDVAVDELIAVGERSYRGVPSMAVDARGRVHILHTTRVNGFENRVGYAVRDADTWFFTHDLASTSQSGSGIVDLDASGTPELYIWNASANRTEVWTQGPSGWAIKDEIELAEIYQVLRKDGDIVALLGDFGGNLYQVTRSLDAWERDYFQRWHSQVTPPGVLVPGRGVAIVESDQITFFTGEVEHVPGPEDGWRRTIGPSFGSDGRMWTLGSIGSYWENEVLLQERAVGGTWSTNSLAVDAPPPPYTECPLELGVPCVFEVTEHLPMGLAVQCDQPVAVLLRETQEVYYERECINPDPDFNGTGDPPCFDEGGPSGPWIDFPRRGPVVDMQLVVNGRDVDARPFAFGDRPTVRVDDNGQLHLSTYTRLTDENDNVTYAIRYLRLIF